MLIGVGGSGKQSLSRLAAFICGFEVRQLSVTSKFKVKAPPQPREEPSGPYEASKPADNCRGRPACYSVFQLVVRQAVLQPLYV